jgi:soluble lytic murein transglycosylase-like protein
MSGTACLWLFCAEGRAQIYSYVDGNGARVLTNVPPTGPVLNLKVDGLPRLSPVPESGSAKKQYASAGTSAGVAAVRSPGKSAAEYDALIEKYAAEYRLDPDLIRSMIATESGFNRYAISPKGAQGLMQLMPATAARLGVADPFDPADNISGGAKHMRYLLDTFSTNPDSLRLSLAAYNAGENLVQRLGRVPAIRETHDYVSSIINRYGKDQMESPSPAPAQKPAVYYFIDENGVLNLTNIPPVQKSGTNTPGGAGPVLR